MSFSDSTELISAEALAIIRVHSKKSLEFSEQGGQDKIKILFLVGSCKIGSKKNCHSGLRSQKSRLEAPELVQK